MRREPDHFGDQDLSLIYIAKKLKEALALEKVLTEAGVDYGVEPDKYKGGIVFQTERVGAFFYVLEETLDSAQKVLTTHGYRPFKED